MAANQSRAESYALLRSNVVKLSVLHSRAAAYRCSPFHKYDVCIFSRSPTLIVSSLNCARVKLHSPHPPSLRSLASLKSDNRHHLISESRESWQVKQKILAAQISSQTNIRAYRAGSFGMVRKRLMVCEIFLAVPANKTSRY